MQKSMTYFLSLLVILFLSGVLYMLDVGNWYFTPKTQALTNIFPKHNIVETIQYAVNNMWLLTIYNLKTLGMHPLIGLEFILAICSPTWVISRLT